MAIKGMGAGKETMRERIRAALGHEECDLVVRGARVLDVFGGGFHEGTIAVKGAAIVGVREEYAAREVIDASGCFVVPGFVDAHVHVESSLATPLRFQQAVLPRGTTTALWDPHEIANVHGRAGVEWALRCADETLMDLFVLLPSCVPATHLETSGASLSAADLVLFLHHPKVLGLAEFMNVHGVLAGDDAALDKLAAFSGVVRDGHAPMVTGKALNAYLCAGIHGCHESTSLPEAREKLAKGMHVLIREGSCAKDADTLLPLVNGVSSSVLALCSDDRNPADIRDEGHIDHVIRMGLARGIAADLLFRVASYGAAHSYGLGDRGVLAPGYLADFAVVRQRVESDWTKGFDVVEVVKSGKRVDAAELGRVAQERTRALVPVSGKRNIHMKPVTKESLRIPASAAGAVGTRAFAGSGSSSERVPCRVIRVHEKSLISDSDVVPLRVRGGEVLSEPDVDVLKIAVCERHHATGNVGVGFVRGFGLREGALAASIGHDCHNVTCVGASDDAVLAAVRAINEMDGGIVVVDGAGAVKARLPLPVGGLMTHEDPSEVARILTDLKAAAHALGCALEEPFLLMSFMALPVIPALKITDKGLVDVEKFAFVPVVP